MGAVLRLGALFAIVGVHGFANGLFNPLLINGTTTTDPQWGMVVNITSSKPDHCSGTVIGPRVIVATASCFKKDSTATFKAGNKTYTAKMTMSSNYPAKEHDMALGITTEDIAVTPATVSTNAVGVGDTLTLFGYGCTDGDNPAFDDQLRMGSAVVTGTQNVYLLSGAGTGVNQPSYVCYRDNGGPAFTKSGSKSVLVAVNTFGDRKSKNYSVPFSIDMSKQFFNDFISQNPGAEICGVNLSGQKCDGTVTPDAPSCNLVARPPKVKTGEVVSIVMTARNATAATIDGTTANPNGDTRNITTSSKGTFPVHGTVSGPGGSAVCDTTYQVEDPIDPGGDAPTCTLTATPQKVKIGGTVTLELTVTGQADYASIAGTAVAFPVGRLLAKPTDKGDVAVKGFVRGPKGASNCYAWYGVDDIGSNPQIPNFAVVPMYCGDNTANSKVQQVCLGVVKKDAAIADLRTNYALYITYKNNDREAMAILGRAPIPPAPGTTVDPTAPPQDELFLYANSSLVSDTFQVMDTRPAKLTRMATAAGTEGSIPLAIEGRAITGEFFDVKQLDAVGTTVTRAIGPTLSQKPTRRLLRR